MTNEEFAALQPGDVVTHEEDGPGVAWTVMQRDFNGTVIVAQVGSIIAPSQWSKLRRPPLADDRATAMAGALDPGLPAGNRRPELIRLQMHPGEAFATLHCGRLEVQVSATAY